FDQCNIQFRMVSFRTCTVPDDVFDNLDKDNACNPDFQARKVNRALENCAELPHDGIPKVIFMGSLTARGLGFHCAQGDIAGAQEGEFVYMTYEGRDPNTLAHELGHLLGLNHPPGS